MEIYIVRNPASIMCDVYLVQHPNEAFNRKGDVIAFYNFKENGECIATNKVYDVGQSFRDMPPTFSIPEPMLRDMINAFTNEAKAQGLPRKEESYLKGKLEGVETHLADMRNLVFTEKFVPISADGLNERIKNMGFKKDYTNKEI